jgi:hypothetical protein
MSEGDRDQVYGTAVTPRLRAMFIRDKPIASASPKGFDRIYPARVHRPHHRADRTRFHQFAYNARGIGALHAQHLAIKPYVIDSSA